MSKFSRKKRETIRLLRYHRKQSEQIIHDGMESIDLQIEMIQASTKTTFRLAIPLHNWLRMKLPWYYRWHLFPYISIVHLIILLNTFIIIVLTYLAYAK